MPAAVPEKIIIIRTYKELKRTLELLKCPKFSTTEFTKETTHSNIIYYATEWLYWEFLFNNNVVITFPEIDEAVKILTKFITKIGKKCNTSYLMNDVEIEIEPFLKKTLEHYWNMNAKYIDRDGIIYKKETIDIYSIVEYD